MRRLVFVTGWSMLAPMLAVQADGSVPSTEPPSASVSPETVAGPVNTPLAAFHIVLGWLNGESFTERDYEQTMDPTFLAAVPFDAVAADLPALVDQGPWTLVGTLGMSTSSGAWEVAPAGSEGT